MSTKTLSMEILLQDQLLTTRFPFLRYAIDKVCVDGNIIHLSCGNEKNKAAMTQYLSKYLFEKYEDEEMFATSQCGLPVSI